MSEHNELDFSSILATSAHDMKNSLGMMLNRLDEVIDELPEDINESAKIASVQQEAKRLNNNLIELLTLYRMENERISPMIDQVDVEEFLQEIVAENQTAVDSSGVNLTCNCDEELNGYFDEGLVHGIINNLIGNALRYTERKIEISAAEKDGYLVISVEDDGAGFTDAYADSSQRQLHEVGGVAAHYRHGAPDRDRGSDDVPAVRAVREHGDGHAERCVEDGEGEPHQETHLGVAGAELDGLADDLVGQGGDLALDRLGGAPCPRSIAEPVDGTLE